jgi:hypothetical protein
VLHSETVQGGGFVAKKVLEYKGHPHQRQDNMIYYGSFADKYVIMMQILETKKVKDLDVATKVSVQLQLTDTSVKSRDRIVKKTEKDSLYSAIDVAAVWLDRALASR